MTPFFKFEGPPLPCPHRLYLDKFYSIQRQVAKDFSEAVDKLNLNIDNYNGIKNLEMHFVSQKKGYVTE